MAELSGGEIDRLLSSSRNIAVIGASNRPGRPARYVPEYMIRHGYRVFPVNPSLAGEELWGTTVVASVDQVPEPVHIVNVFRKSQDVAGHLEEILALDPRPRAVWLQLGIRNEEVARALEGHGIAVVQDRCLLIEHGSRQR